MEKSGNSGRRLEAFFAGKGFYIVLFLCAAVIGVSAWILMTDSGTDVEFPIGELSETVAEARESAAPAPVPLETEPEDPEPLVRPETLSEESTAAEPVQEETQPVWAPAAPASTPALFVWPVNGPVEAPYAMTWLRYDNTMADWRTHDGLDIAAALGEHVLAVSGGTVQSVYTDDLYGVTVVIDHGDGLVSRYANLAETPTVYAGSVVSAGEVIGAVGDTALCETGEVTHLHLSMSLGGESVDPGDYLP